MRNVLEFLNQTQTQQGNVRWQHYTPNTWNEHTAARINQKLRMFQIVRFL